MGRMFRIISEGTHEPRPVPAVAGRAGVAVAERQVESWPAEEPAPFVEVGGPDGVVTSHPRPSPTPIPVPPPIMPLEIARPVEDEVASVDTDAPPEPRALSVSFHRFPKSGLRLLPAGVSSDVIAFHHPDHAVSAEYASVRDEIRKQFEEAGPRVVMFTSATAVSGTTTVLVNVATLLARESAGKVLTVDANLVRPAVSRLLGVPETPGVAEVLAQTVPLAWAVQPSPVANLHVLAAGRKMPADGFPTTDFPRLLNQLRQWFDWVLVDAGVWPESDSRDHLAPSCDGIFLVARQGEIDRPEFTGLRSSVASAGGLLRGYVTTQ